MANLNWNHHWVLNSIENHRAAIYTFNGDFMRSQIITDPKEMKIDIMQKNCAFCLDFMAFCKNLKIQKYRLEMGTKIKFGKVKNYIAIYQKGYR